MPKTHDAPTLEDLLSSFILVENELQRHGLELAEPGEFQNRKGWTLTQELVDPLIAAPAKKRRIAKLVKRAKELKASQFASYVKRQTGFIGLIHVVELWESDDAVKASRGDDINNI
jgi:hypothetical protein